MFGLLNFIGYSVTVWINRKYLQFYVTKKDDLEGDTEINKRLIKEKSEHYQTESLWMTGQKIFLPLSMLLLNFAYYAPVNRLYFIGYKANIAACTQKEILFTYNLGELIGGITSLFIQASRLSVFIGLLVLRMLLSTVVAYDVRNQPLKSDSRLYLYMVGHTLNSALSGYLASQLAAYALTLVSDKNRKHACFLIFTVSSFGISYGDFSTLATFK